MRTVAAEKFVSEAEVVHLWQGASGARITTAEGEAIEVVCPGRQGKGGGPDFRDAILLMGPRGILKGDVEVHARAGEWLSHGHYRDPAYNSVILHVVFRNDLERGTHLQNGKQVPTLALEGQAPAPPPAKGAGAGAPAEMPCGQKARELGLQATGRSLDKAGAERFLDKARRFGQAMAEDGPGEALYQGLMVALGYSKNKAPFGELARRLPLSQIEGMAITQRGKGLQGIWQAMLLQAAGLSQPGGGLPWCFRGRPNNLPTPRIIAASHLLFRYRKPGLLAGLTGLLARSPLKGGHRLVEEGIVLQGKAGASLGWDRAREVVVNVLLPFTFAWATETEQPELRKKAFAFYWQYPGMKANAISLHMGNSLLSWVSPEERRRFTGLARRHQGLLQLYQVFCCQGRCAALTGL